MYSITSAQIFIPKRAILRFSVGARYGLVVQAPQPVVDERDSGPYGKQSRVLPHRPLQNQVFLDVQRELKTRIVLSAAQSLFMFRKFLLVLFPKDSFLRSLWLDSQ